MTFKVEVFMTFKMVPSKRNRFVKAGFEGDFVVRFVEFTVGFRSSCFILEVIEIILRSNLKIKTVRSSS